MKKFNGYAQQGGYTLLELIIAGALGLVLLLGVVQIYLGASNTNNFQSSVIEVQDNGRFVLAFLEKDIQRSGWVNAELTNAADVTTLGNHIDFAQSTNGTDAGNNNSDTLTVLYEADDTPGVEVEYDCDGTAITGGSLITNQYTITQESVADTSLSLKCNNRTLVRNVESMQILYGIDSTGDDIVDGYVRADQIGTFQTDVMTIRIGLVISSTNEVLEQDNTNSYQVLDSIFVSPGDRKLRRVFYKTILLPNRPQVI